MSRFHRIASNARRDMLEIRNFIARDNSAAATKMLRRFESKFQMLARQPLIGEATPDLGQDIRCVVEGRYLIFYRPIETVDAAVKIVRALHGMRDVHPDMF